MIYFLINNNIHLIDAEEHLKNLEGFKIGLIKIPHKLTIDHTYVFDFEFEYPYLIRSRKDFFDIRRIKSIHRKIRNDFVNVDNRDTLIFYTEFEYLNHYVIKLFKDRNAQIIMLDEGFATYESLLNRSGPKISLKEKLLQYYFNYVLRYTYTSVVIVNNIARPRIADTYIDKVLLYNKVNVERDLQTYLLNKKQYSYKCLDENKVIFLNERMYDYYMHMDEYLNILADILFNLSDQFKIVYFKFHPREGQEQKEIILKIIEKFERVTILNDESPVELIIDKIGTKYIASFFAQILLNHSNSNCVVLYLFHKYPQIMRNPIFGNLKRLLDKLDYSFFNKWSDIKSNGIGFSKANFAENNRLPLNMYI
jgi:hypothetical protein